MTDSLSPDLQQLQKNIHEALRAWQKFNNTVENLLSDLLLVQQERQSLISASPTALRLATNQVLLEHIKALGEHEQQAAKILTMRFIDDVVIKIVANRLNLSPDQVKRQQATAIESLASLIFARETAARQVRAHAIELSLNPPTYSRLFGVDEFCNTLVERLLLTAPPWVLAIVGIGGIGKTSLADMAVRQVIRHFHYKKVVWLRVAAPIVDYVGYEGYEDPENIHTAPFQATLDKLMLQLAQTICPHLSPETAADVRNLQVRQTLKTIPHLIIIDNLEFEADSAYLFPLLNDLANPTKFLLTTRTHAPGQTGVFSLSLKELSREDTAAFICDHAQNINFGDLADADPSEIQSIYHVIGGNPLAIKLVVGLAVVHPLAEVLEDLIAVQADKIETMYRHIYWQAWRTLSPESRALLEVMPLVADLGSTLVHMMAISGLAKKQLLPAINELVNRSLLETSGTMSERRYNIHRLTETFLRTEIIHWPEDWL